MSYIAASPRYRETMATENGLSWTELSNTELSNGEEFGLELPAGEQLKPPALGSPRPALRVTPKTLPPDHAEPNSGSPDPLRRFLKPARAFLSRREEQTLPCAVPALARLLPAGLPCGALTEITGRRTSGRFSLLLGLLAAATAIGEASAFIDLGDGLDPRSAAGAGVDLARLLWLRPRRFKDALLAAEAVLATGFPLVALDLGLPPVPGSRGLESAWVRLARAARDRGTALLISSPYRISGPAAQAVLTVERDRVHWRHRQTGEALLLGFESHLTLEKHRGRVASDEQAPGHAGTSTLALRLATVPPQSAPIAPRQSPRSESVPVAGALVAAAGA